MNNTPNSKRLRAMLRSASMATVAVACTFSLLTGCATRERVVVHERVVEHPVTVTVRHMPQPIQEDRGGRPGHEWEWVPGHWKWEGHDWFWVHGKWVEQHVEPMPPVIVEEVTAQPSPHHFWVPGHWVWRFDGRGGWVWVRGGWHR